MMKDPIIEEIYRAREAHSKQFNYDLDAICEDMRKREIEAGYPTVSLGTKRVARGKNL